MTDKQKVAEVVARFKLVHDPDPSYRSQMLQRADGQYVRFSDYESLSARLAEVEADRADWIAREAVCGADAVAARKAAAENFARAEAAEARVTDLEALLAAYQDKTVPDLTAVYIAGGMDRRDEVARLRAELEAVREKPPVEVRFTWAEGDQEFWLHMKLPDGSAAGINLGNPRGMIATACLRALAEPRT